MSEELKPCPFCGDVPELPSGDGTQYEIECGGCGQAMASVQICDLMTPEERTADSFTDYRYAEQFVERAKQQAITNWNRRAQPAKAEVVHDYLVEFAEGEIEARTAIEELLAALSAVTAERDRLESTLIQTTTRHFAQQWKDRADDKKLDECLSEGIAMLEAERDQYRAEVERLRAGGNRTAARETMRRILPDVPGDLLDHALFAAHSAAMAAKEA